MGKPPHPRSCPINARPGTPLPNRPRRSWGVCHKPLAELFTG